MLKENYYTEKCVARKWKLSPKTLQRWRVSAKGPEYIKLGGRVRYSESSIKKFEDKSSPEQKLKNQEVPSCLIK